MEFEGWVAARGPALLRLAFLLTGDHHLAEDITQTALIGVHRRWHRIERDDPDAYARRAVLNAHLDRKRRRASAELPADLAGWETTAAPDLAEALVARSQMWQVLATLPPRQRAVLVLRYYEDCDDRVIADLLDCSESTVRSNAARALAALRRTLPTSASGAES
ncbi:RNA polymerase sigma-70 factor (sigma-E family) [Motilibacter rhizosphaerae]|uniref:RNA polymerase sigma-70 factor (Sigma-E family) n=1 Tax=Motilibacter rhizosphaerae TaxID=598652 RepID=A0A4Q7N7R1_9ACTN|nr:SigE family RNA polymerase sigma factor [Motilibacter rhizosphaerae]RZS77901.1 RNA polymerase sigma-70 factor (sigma-E family) [Motilibacter rhizosphaerae]